MKKIWIEYQATEPNLPMTFWVHRGRRDEDRADHAPAFDPPRQRRVPGKGYPVFKVEVDGFIFAFSSLAEIRECITVLGGKLLPRTIDLSARRGTAKGPNSHWLSRLPAKVKSWRYRQKAVAVLREALAEFERELI